MVISKRQYSALKAMDIPLWVRRDTVQPTENSDINQRQEIREIDENDCKKNQLFNDILLGLELSIAEVSFNENYIDLGLINWSFHSQMNIVLSDNTLLTPTLAELALSPELKAQLWQLFIEQNIICY